MKFPNKKKSEKKKNGVALFLVLSALGLLSILVAELTYVSQLNSRLAYNYVDNLKAYYLAKSGYKLSVLRLLAYMQVKNFIKDQKAAKEALETAGPGIIEKIWDQPFFYPIPKTKGATLTQTNELDEFIKSSRLNGSFIATITSESSKLNLNNLLLKEMPPDTSSSANPSSTQNPNPDASADSSQTPKASPSPMNFKEVLEPALTSLLESKKSESRQFSEVYRNVSGKDVLDAIEAYLTGEQQNSNLPGFQPIKPKNAPFYSLSELHMVPGIDDGLYNLLADSLTVYSTPGININTINKRTLMSILPGISVEDAERVLVKRDDKDFGKPWENETSFWDTVKAEAPTVAGNISNIQDSHKKAGLKLITSEESFKIIVQAKVGLSTKRLEAFVSYGEKKEATPNGSSAGGLQGQQSRQNNPAIGVAPTKDSSSAKKPLGVNLIYWRML